MFVYLSKKIAVPNGVGLRSISWNYQDGWIAVGGNDGLLKVIQLNYSANKGTSTLSMNQNLEGHTGGVVVSSWNHGCQKLTTSDEFGLIIVWMLHNGTWYEEMINNRKKSVVKDMSWSSDGQKICIVYEDGAVLVGSVDGNRIWGKELDVELSRVCWSPDGTLLLFCTKTNDIKIYDCNGHFMYNLPMGEGENSSGSNIIALDWYDGLMGYEDVEQATLAVVYENGRAQILRKESDTHPVLINASMTVLCAKWNPQGTILAMCGSKYELRNLTDVTVHLFKFFNSKGDHLRTLVVPGSGVTAFSWNGSGTQLALTVDSFIYFANVPRNMPYVYFSNTLVYAVLKPDSVESCVSFWDTHSNEQHVKYVRQLRGIAAGGEHCVLSSSSSVDDDDVEEDGTQYILIICSSIGSPIDSKYIDLEPRHMCMTEHNVIVASDSCIYCWTYNTREPSSSSSSAATSNLLTNTTLLDQQSSGDERFIHLDDPLHASASLYGSKRQMSKLKTGTKDPVVAVCARKHVLIVARSSGLLYKYLLPNLQFEQKFDVSTQVSRMDLNCDSSTLSIIDVNGFCTLLNVEEKEADDHRVVEFKRKDAWDMKWSEDNPDLFAVMEKTRMYIYRDRLPEEPIQSSAALCSFADLEIIAVDIDLILKDPTQVNTSSLMTFDTKSLRDTRVLLQTTPIIEAFNFIEDNPHPRLWRLLAEEALEKLHFDIAEKAFVQSRDYQGIKFVKRLKMMQDDVRQRAEIAAYFRRFEDAEELYLKSGNKQLAIELRMKLGDWFRVVQLLQNVGGSDELLARAYNSIGDYYADRMKWAKASKYYLKSHNTEALIECAYNLEDFDSLEKQLEELPEGSAQLDRVAQHFMSVGLSEQAVEGFLKCGSVKKAIDCCVVLNHWAKAVELAEAHAVPEIGTILSAYAAHLLGKGENVQAVELYRKASMHADASRLLARLANESMARQQQKHSTIEALLCKKLFVLSALEMEEHKRSLLLEHDRGAMSSTQTLEQLMSVDESSSAERGKGRGAQDTAWAGAEAMHFLILAHTQLYNQDYDAAFKTALRLSAYDNILPPRLVYSLIALTSYHNRFFRQCSRAFMKLEVLEGASKKERSVYKKLAFRIFSQKAPEDPSTRAVACPNSKCNATVQPWSYRCQACSSQIGACVASGRPILSGKLYMCPSCKHQAYQSELGAFDYCPLCHAFLR